MKKKWTVYELASQSGKATLAKHPTTPIVDTARQAHDVAVRIRRRERVATWIGIIEVQS